MTIYPGARLGDRVIVHVGAVLGSDGFGYAQDQSTGRYEKFPQRGHLEIEDDVEIGANTTVDRGDVLRLVGTVTEVERAAKLLGLTPPSLSRMLRDLGMRS